MSLLDNAREKYYMSKFLFNISFFFKFNISWVFPRSLVFWLCQQVVNLLLCEVKTENDLT